MSTLNITPEELDQAGQGVITKKFFKKLDEAFHLGGDVRHLDYLGYSGAVYFTSNGSGPHLISPRLLGRGPCHSGFEAGHLMVDFPQVLYNVETRGIWNNDRARLSEAWDSLNEKYLKWLTTKSYLAPCFSVPYKKGILIFNPQRPSFELKTAMIASRLLGEIAFNSNDQGILTPSRLEDFRKKVGGTGFYLFLTAFCFTSETVRTSGIKEVRFPHFDKPSSSGHSVLAGQLSDRLIAAIFRNEWLERSVLNDSFKRHKRALAGPALTTGIIYAYRLPQNNAPGLSAGVHASHLGVGAAPSFLFATLKRDLNMSLSFKVIPKGWATERITTLSCEEFSDTFFKVFARHLNKWKRLVKKGEVLND